MTAEEVERMYEEIGDIQGLPPWPFGEHPHLRTLKELAVAHPELGYDDLNRLIIQGLVK